MEVKTFTPEQLVDYKVIPLRGQALKYFRNLEKLKKQDGGHYELLTSPEKFASVVAVIFSNHEEVGTSRKEIYEQLMFYSYNSISLAGELLYGLTYGKINFISSEKEIGLGRFMKNGELIRDL